MKSDPDHNDRQIDLLERLISRALDDELTPDEQNAFEARLASDPAAARRYEELADIDALVSDMLRLELAAEPTVVTTAPAAPWWRTFGVAAAACIAALLYYGERPAGDAPDDSSGDAAQAGVVAGESIWADVQVDGLTPVDPEVFDRLRAGVQDVDRDWVIIPSDEPGEYLLIEVSRVRTEAYALHADL